jgi:hypothetical protein
MSAIACGFCGEQPARISKYCAICGTPSNATVLPFPSEDLAKASASAREGALATSKPAPVKPWSAEDFKQATSEIRNEIKSASWVYKLFFVVMAIGLLYGLWQKLFESDENKRELPSTPARSTVSVPAQAARAIETPVPIVQNAPVQPAEARQYSGGIPKEHAIAFARKWFDAGSTASGADDILPFYSSAVDYYKKGVVNRKFIADDKASFIKRWPVRKNVMGDILFLGVGDKGEARLAIPFRWEVENSTQSKSGSASIELSIQDFDGQLLIVRESGG